MGSGTPLDHGTPYWPAVDYFLGIDGLELALHNPTSGGTWVNHPALSGGDCVLTANNRIRLNATSTSGYYITATPSSPDYDVSADIYCYTDPASLGVGVIGRASTTAYTFYSARYRSTAGWQLWVYNASSPTQLGVTTGSAMTPGQSFRVTLRMKGTSISLLLNGVVIIGPIMDSTIATAGVPGVFMSGANTPTDSTGEHLTNFNATFSDPPIPAVFPDIAAGPRRTSSSGYAGQLSPGPTDQLQQAWWHCYPDIAAGPRRTSSSAYAGQLATTPGDIGSLPVAPTMPARVEALGLRVGNYATSTLPSKPDQGLNQPVVPTVLPDRAANAPAYRLPAYLLDVTPQNDQGLQQNQVVSMIQERASFTQPLRQQAYNLIAFVMGDNTGTLVPQQLPVLIPDRAPGAVYRTAAYACLQPPPLDMGLAQRLMPTAYPDRAPGALRTSAAAYLIAQPGPKLDPPGIRVLAPDRMWRPWPAAIYTTAAIPPPLDPGQVQLIWVTPDRTQPIPRQAIYAVIVPPPADQGLPVASVIFPTYPDRAPGAAYCAAAYFLDVTPQQDIGLLQAIIPTVLPDRAPAPAYRSAAYWLDEPPQGDVGLLASIVPTILPDRADAPRRAASSAYALPQAGPTPLDFGITQEIIPAAFPDRADGARRTASSAYTLPTAVPAPPDMGVAQRLVPTAYPDRADGARRTASSAYVVPPTVPAPPDFGITQPIVPEVSPDRAPGQPYRTAAYALIVTPQTDQGAILSLIPPVIAPDRAAAAAYRSAAYSLDVTPQGDVGLAEPVIPTVLPDRAAAAAYRSAAYACLQPPPRDQGGIPPQLVAPAYPDLARGPQRTAASAYSILVTATLDNPLPAGIPPLYPPIAAGALRTAASAYALATAPSPLDQGLPLGPFWLPGSFVAAILPSALDSTDPFGVDPGQTTTIPAGADSDPFGVDPGQTTVITTGLDTGP